MAAFDELARPNLRELIGFEGQNSDFQGAHILGVQSRHLVDWVKDESIRV